jgi:hypothetical protein
MGACMQSSFSAMKWIGDLLLIPCESLCSWQVPTRNRAGQTRALLKEPVLGVECGSLLGERDPGGFESACVSK